MTRALTRFARKFFATLQRRITRSRITEVSFGALVKFQLVRWLVLGLGRSIWMGLLSLRAMDSRSGLLELGTWC